MCCATYLLLVISLSMSSVYLTNGCIWNFISAWTSVHRTSEGLLTLNQSDMFGRKIFSSSKTSYSTILPFPDSYCRLGVRKVNKYWSSKLQAELERNKRHSQLCLPSPSIQIQITHTECSLRRIINSLCASHLPHKVNLSTASPLVKHFSIGLREIAYWPMCVSMRLSAFIGSICQF